MRYPSGERLAALAGINYRTWREGPVLCVLADQFDGDQRSMALLHRVSLAAGATRTIELGAARIDRAVVAGTWLAWSVFDRTTVDLYERGEPRHSFAIPPRARPVCRASRP